ncbi:TPA: hypothetical protein QDB19_004043 [Burkholderia vietnamiensis]|nr:hypothetical protein [Burkholderia vietnamiensis]
MKRFLIALIAGAISVASTAATYVPVQLLNPIGSTSGQAIVSTGASSSPAWSSIVDSVVAGSGVAVSGATGNVTVSVATNGVALGQIAQQSANSVLANATSSTGNVTAFTMPSCSSSANALQWASGSGFACNSSINAASLGGTAAASYALLASPSLTGTPTAPTATTGTNTSQLATTAFVNGSIAAATGRLLNIQVFSSSGTYTPTAGTTHALVRVQAPGGGSGGTSTTTSSTISIGGAGSAGSYAEAWWSSPTSQTVTIGNVGAAGTAAAAGGTGGTTSVGSIISCPGGVGGSAGAANTPPFMVAPAASPSPCTISGATAILSIGGGRGQFGTAISTAVANVATGGVGYLGAGNYGTPSGYGSGAGSASIATSSTGASGFASSPGIAIILDYQ